MLRACSRSFFYAATAVLAACGGEAADVPPAPTPMPANLAGFYTGEFPCSNCPGIDAALWLRDDGAFILRQRYRPGDDNPGTVSHGLGRWRWDADAARLVLDGAGPDRRFRYAADATLTLETVSPLPHVVARAAPETFTDTVRIDALVVIGDNGATLTECLSRLAFPIVDGGASTDLRRLYGRLVSRGRPARVDVEARLVPGAEGAGGAERWHVERLVNLNPRESC